LQFRVYKSDPSGEHLYGAAMTSDLDPTWEALDWSLQDLWDTLSAPRLDARLLRTIQALGLSPAMRRRLAYCNDRPARRTHRLCGRRL
jgi:hypothetical protein